MGRSLGQLVVKQENEMVGWDPDDSARQAGDDAGLTTVGQLKDVPDLFDGFVAPAIRHSSSRAGNPQLRTHVLVAN